MPNPTKFETKAPVTYSKEGINLRDLLGFASGKTKGEQVTGDDFNNLLSQSGVSGKDARRLTKAFETVSRNSNLDYILSTSGDSFNVFDKSTGEALTKSSRKTGSSKGITLADMIKLGDNVSNLAGFANNKINDYLKPKGETTPVEKPVVTELPVVTDPATLKKDVQDYKNQQGAKKKAGVVAKPEDKNLTALLQNPSMRQFMLNPNTSSTEVTNSKPPVPGSVGDIYGKGLPDVKIDYPKVDLGGIKKAIGEQEATRIQKEYSIHLKRNYSGLHDYLTGKKKNMTSSERLYIKGDLGLLKSKQAPMYQYLIKYHKGQLDKLN